MKAFSIKPQIAFGLAALAALFATSAHAQSGSLELSCASISDHDRAYCPLPTDASHVALSRQYSDAPCIFGETWGLTDTALWTDAGCSASFTVRQGPPQRLEDTTTSSPPQGLTDGKSHGYVNGRFRREA